MNIKRLFGLIALAALTTIPAGAETLTEVEEAQETQQKVKSTESRHSHRVSPLFFISEFLSEQLFQPGGKNGQFSASRSTSRFFSMMDR